MADEDRSFAPSTVSSNRAQTQGLGVGQEEMDKQQAPDGQAQATDPQRTEPFDQSLDPTTNADRPAQADFAGQEPEDANRRPPAATSAPQATGDLGVGAPPSVDIHDLGQEDKPQQDWGEEVEGDAVFSSNHTRRPERTEAERGQGARTRRLNKDIVSRRA